MRIIAPAAHDLVDLAAAAGLHRYAGSNRASIGFSTREQNRKKVLVRSCVFQEAGRRIHVDDDDFRAAVAIKITHGETAGRAKHLEGGPRLRRHILKFAIPKVPVDQGLLQIAVPHGRAIDNGEVVEASGRGRGPDCGSQRLHEKSTAAGSRF